MYEYVCLLSSQDSKRDIEGVGGVITFAASTKREKGGGDALYLLVIIEGGTFDGKARLGPTLLEC